MTNILFLVETIQCKQSRCIYLKNKKSPSEFFCPFSKSTLSFKYFQQKMNLIAYVFPKLRTPKDVVRSMSKKARLRGLLDRQDGKRSETLTQSQCHHLYHIH